MKTRYIVLWILIAMAFAAVPVFGQVDAPPPVTPPSGPDTSSALKPIYDLMMFKGGWMAALATWFATFSAAMSPFAIWFRNRIADSMNAAAESESEDDDEVLRMKFSNPIYQIGAILLNFINIRLPTLSELNRAVALQKEAVRDAIDAKVGPSPNLHE